MIGLLEFAAKQHLATISLEVRSESNQAAIALYKKFGFSERESLFLYSHACANACRHLGWLRPGTLAANDYLNSLFPAVGRRKRYYKDPPEDAVILGRSTVSEEELRSWGSQSRV